MTIDESVPEAAARFERTLRDAIAGDPWLDAHPPRIERTGAAFGSSSIAPDHPLVAALCDAAQSETGARPATIGVPYGCDMAPWRRVAGAACVVYGPGEIAHAHAVDERVPLAEVTTTARVLEAAVRTLLR